MQIISENELVEYLNNEKPLNVLLCDGAFELRINEYVPYICTAIHAGRNLRSSLTKDCLINEDGRLQEEDPFTDLLIDSFPITLVARDSRYEYDLNRNINDCVYENAWGKPVWNEPLSKAEIEKSHHKHRFYYRILKNIVDKLERKFGGCLLIDMHSYNWQIRKLAHAPVFNIGTKQINMALYDSHVKLFLRALSSIKLPNLNVDAECDSVFKGEGYQATFVKENLTKTLIIPLEIKKIFMDENTSEIFPLVLEKLREGLYTSVLELATNFNHELNGSKLKSHELIPADIEPIVFMVDKQLFKLAKKIETLNYVNPVNVQQEKRKFLSSNSYNPDFQYRQLRIDPYLFKEKLYALPVSDIQDPLLRSLYRSVIESHATKVEMLVNVGTNQFLYNSLRYYGEPSLADVENAKFILHASNPQGEIDPEHKINAHDAKLIFEKAASDMGIDCKVILSNKIIAKAMVDNSNRSLLINKYFNFSMIDINALIQHEIGVHMATTLNAHSQPLNIFKLGLPGNTYTQEGLAILSEYLSGNINLSRLKQLSLRVLAVDMMTSGIPFRTVFNRMRDDYNLSFDESFAITTRVFRGGGFTKDYLYLKGFKDLLNLYDKSDVTPLLIGKTGIKFYDTIVQLLERKVFQAPKHILPVFAKKIIPKSNAIDYLISCIK